MKIRLILCCFLLWSCTSVKAPENFRHVEIKTPDFNFATWQKITDKTAEYKIYIEGDGFAFNARGLPTADPTPHGRLVRYAAFGDDHPNVIYMARACQFLQGKKCAQKYWTTGRFAPEIIEAQADALKQIVGSYPVTLVGFSGGAQIAGLIAVRHPEIKIHKIITIAGNLDHQAWTEYHNVPPLKDSLNLSDYHAEFDKIEQIHYVGTDDVVMPPSLARNFVIDTATVIEVKGAEHNSGWNDILTQIQAQ